MLLSDYFSDLERSGEKIYWVMVSSLTLFSVRLFLTLFLVFLLKTWKLEFRDSTKWTLRERIAKMLV
jgi:hypothetical protein